MELLDLNLLSALEALLAEESVTGAARRLSLSASAMSRTLARLRTATGDPLLVRAGRRLVATPHALALRARVPSLLREAQAILRPSADPLDPAALDATFTLRAGEWFMDWIAPALTAHITQVAGGVRLHFMPKTDKDLRHLREGSVDLEVGAIDAYGEQAPEVRAQLLFRDAFVGVVRSGHPLLDAEPVTPEGFASCKHVAAVQRAGFKEPVDEALEGSGLSRQITTLAPDYGAALRIVRVTDLVAVVPHSTLHGAAAAQGAQSPGLQTFNLPITLKEIVVSAMWHPRMDADPAHRWIRSQVIDLSKKLHP